MDDPTPPLDEAFENRRRDRRSRMFKTGWLIYGGFSPTVVDCLIIEMSEGGARVETGVMLQVPEILRLRMNDENKTEHRLRRAWARGHEIGLEFLSEAAEVAHGASGGAGPRAPA
jgi:hypothetical protein